MRYGGFDEPAWIEPFRLVDSARRPHRGRPTEAKMEIFIFESSPRCLGDRLLGGETHSGGLINLA